MHIACCICGEPTDALDATCLVWHARCYTPQAFDEHVLPKVNAYIDGLHIKLAPVIRENLITELVRQQMRTRGLPIFHDLAALRNVVTQQFNIITKAGT